MSRKSWQKDVNRNKKYRLKASMHKIDKAMYGLMTDWGLITIIIKNFNESKERE